MKRVLFLISLLVSSAANAGQMVYQFNNPQFSGQGWDSHALTIENEEYTRKQAIKQQEASNAAAAAAAAQNTNISKFLNNLESRIYAQLSLQLSNAMFSGNATSGSIDFQGSTIAWVQNLPNNTIDLTITDPNGNVTNVSVPVGTFAF
jgi:hypothetical protein